MINPEEFLNLPKAKEEKDYSRFQKMDSSYRCNHQLCDEMSTMSYWDTDKNLIIWVCKNGHENKATIR